MPSSALDRRRYAAHKERARARQARQALAGRDIGDLPPVADPIGKGEAGRNLRVFLERYFPDSFPLAWSEDHLRLIAKIEQVVVWGGLLALALPRGSGKTTCCERAAIWAAANGLRSYVVLIGADQGAAVQNLESIKSELETNDRLAADYPEVCHPIRCLEGIHNRAKGQLYQGQRTRIGWTQNRVILPTIPASPASGAIIQVAGITGRIRGMKYSRQDGTQARPDLVIPDDPQTDQAARSPSQCATRERILCGAILGLAGPQKKISAIMPCTVIRPGDMADRVLDRRIHPEWQGERARLLYAEPARLDLWERYAELRKDGLAAGDEGRAATDFYRDNREAMDAGAKPAWPERFNADELSAVQYAMNLKIDDLAAFQAEYQNDPLEETADSETLDVDEVIRRTNGLKRGIVPLWANWLTCHVDVQKNLLYYAVCAFAKNFTGALVEFGTFPDQQRQYFALRDATRTLARRFPKAGLEGSILAGLQALLEGDNKAPGLLRREWKDEAGNKRPLSLALIDGNWGSSTETVYQYCRTSFYTPILLPAHGVGITASSKPFSEYRKQPGDLIGLNWRIPKNTAKRAHRYVLFDTNFWKSTLHARLSTAPGDAGSFTLHAGDAKSLRMIAEHLTAEYRTKTTGRGRTVDEWQMRPGRADNHGLDNVVGCAVGAAILGSQLPHLANLNPRRPARNRRRVDYL